MVVSMVGQTAVDWTRRRVGWASGQVVLKFDSTVQVLVILKAAIMGLLTG